MSGLLWADLEVLADFSFNLAARDLDSARAEVRPEDREVFFSWGDFSVLADLLEAFEEDFDDDDFDDDLSRDEAFDDVLSLEDDVIVEACGLGCVLLLAASLELSEF